MWSVANAYTDRGGERERERKRKAEGRGRGGAGKQVSEMLFLPPSAENLLNFFQLCYRSGSVAELLGKASLWDDDITGESCDGCGAWLSGY